MTTARPPPPLVRRRALAAAALLVLVASGAAAAPGPKRGARPFAELVPTAVIALGKTADWVAITDEAVWVGTTGPDAVHEIDPRTNARIATVPLPGKPCAGLAAGFGSLWVPLCGRQNVLARVDLRTRAVTWLPERGPAASEGGITASADSIWLVAGHGGKLIRIDPASGEVRQAIVVPRGSYNPLYADGRIWVTRAGGAEVTLVDAEDGALQATIAVGPGPRFLAAGGGAVWTLNQGDGSLTRIDAGTHAVVQSVALGTPGPGGDIRVAAGIVWTTMQRMPLTAVDAASGALLCQWAGPGGDSLGIGHGAIWLTDLHAGTVSRFELAGVIARCRGAEAR
ncbi:MAG TPA: PQQ-binding-like beta-propeller repeat protein [Steroidobacteraceae bacterium]|nr:PQQ-binding-like beta-propeller repeat protein [Steroidobacteraceae bacterium]